jgi:putative transposase
MSKGLKRKTALTIASITRHQLYHRPSGERRRGRAESSHTKRIVGSASTMVANSEVERKMLDIDRDPDLACGRLRMTYQLQGMGFVINQKKVARLMSHLGIVKNKKRGDASRTKQYVQNRVVNPTEPLRSLQMDIKQFRLIGERRAYYVITVIDTFTREVLGHLKGYSVKATDVKKLWCQIILTHFEPAGLAAEGIVVEIRSDNGPQFIAEVLKAFFLENHIEHVFTKPYTPEENGHIESFHSIMEKCLGNVFMRAAYLDERIERFYRIYNTKRAHSATKGLPPQQFKKAWENDLVITCHDQRKPTKIRLRVPIYQIPGTLSQRELLAENTRAKRSRSNKMSGEMTSSAHNAKTPVYTSSSVASCVANEVTETSLN